MSAVHFKVPARNWPGDRSYVQGLLIHKPSGTRIVHQHGPVFRCHKADGTYLSTATVPGIDSHGSSIGIESTGPDTMRLWFRNEKAGCTGYTTLKVGQSGSLPFKKVGILPEGDVSIDQAADLLCIRSGNHFRGYRLSAVNNGKATELWDFTIPGWGNRFQGHLVFGGKLYVHRDIATKAASRANVFDYTGKPLTMFDTTKMGDEAEGFCEIDGTVYAVKRTGGTGPSRYVAATPLPAVKAPDPKPPTPPKPPKPPAPKRLHGVDVSSYQPDWTPAAGDSFVFVKATEGTSYQNPARAAQLAAARDQGLLTGHYHWLVPGKPLEQAAYFVKNADIRAGDPLWADWEKQSDGTMPTIQDVAAFIAEVQRLVPTSKVGLYCNRDAWTGTSVKAGDGLWIAQYGVDAPNTSTDWVIWQYSDKPIDQNVSKFTTKADLVKWTKVNRTPPVVKPPVVPDAKPLPPVVPPTPENVGVWVVDPSKVSTVLLGRDGAGKIGRELSPATTISDGVAFIKNSVGRYALLRSDGYSYDREFLVQVGVGPVPVKRQFPIIPDYDTTERIPFRGGLVCRCLAIWLPWLEFAWLEAGVIKFNIDIYQLGYRGDVKASALTHNKGQMVDLGQYSDLALKIERELGGMGQRRTVAQGFTGNHNHGGPRGCPHGSNGTASNPGAKQQEAAWLNGRDGLQQNRPITGPGPTGKATPKWDAALSAYLKTIGAPPVRTI